MNSPASQYLQKIVETQQENMGRACSIIANAIRDRRIIYVFGTGGHDNRAAEELLWRAGMRHPPSSWIRARP